MSDMSFFYSSMSSVLTQWSDFKVSKNLYKSYFDMQKSLTATTSDSAKKTEDKTKKSASTATDKLKTYANNLTSSAGKLEAAFKADEKTGELDMDKAYSAAEEFVNSFNELYSSIRSSGNQAVSNRSEFIANMTNAYTRKLEKVGISVNSDGTLALDKDSFNSADSDDFAEIFGKKNSFASFMSSQASGLAAYAGTAAYLTPDTYSKVDLLDGGSSKTTAASGYLYDKYF